MSGVGLLSSARHALVSGTARIFGRDLVPDEVFESICCVRVLLLYASRTSDGHRGNI
jgi:hypothetical protein